MIASGDKGDPCRKLGVEYSGRTICVSRRPLELDTTRRREIQSQGIWRHTINPGMAEEGVVDGRKIRGGRRAEPTNQTREEARFKLLASDSNACLIEKESQREGERHSKYCTTGWSVRGGRQCQNNNSLFICLNSD
ncbi:unnamed protein product [Caenorhabditis auriculariae]|uniref:Uncharacterized protein n=1 Tax=Caenorhabditis auriculariae TaxID=2777116 RepID=A0A8S1HNV7_9PELO|nr:unnamed protein product [Caenorhabditis auriculariae]